MTTATNVKYIDSYGRRKQERTSMTPVYTATATPIQLCWMLAVAQGVPVHIYQGDGIQVLAPMDDTQDLYMPTSDWTVTGPLRDKHRVDVLSVHPGSLHYQEGHRAVAMIRGSGPDIIVHGATACEAITRALVFHLRGEVVSVPSILVHRTPRAINCTELSA